MSIRWAPSLGDPDAAFKQIFVLFGWRLYRCLWQPSRLDRYELAELEAPSTDRSNSMVKDGATQCTRDIPRKSFFAL